MQGWREDFEDEHFIAGHAGSEAAFGVLDGHAGSAAARLAATVLPEELARSQPAAAFAATDARLRAAGVDDGTTAVCALVSETAQGYRVRVANAGDSRAVLVRAGAVALATEDHKPARADERARIEAAGGTVKTRGADPALRVDGDLSVSRGLGDFKYKDEALPLAAQKVSAVPEEYAADLVAGDLVILACDGVWDVLSSEELVARVLPRAAGDLGALAADVLASLLAVNPRKDPGLDNMTLVLVRLGPVEESEVAQHSEVRGLGFLRALQEARTNRAYIGFLRALQEAGKLPATAQARLEAVLAEKATRAAEAKATAQARLEAVRAEKATRAAEAEAKREAKRARGR